MVGQDADKTEDINERERTTIDEARREGIGEPEEGIELGPGTYAEDSGIVDLGVEEPVVPEPLTGKEPPQPEHRRARNDKDDLADIET